MKEGRIFPARRMASTRAERMLALVGLWRDRPDLLRAILSIKGAPSRVLNPSRWFDLASRMLRPICCVNWTVEQKVARIVDHHATIHALGGILRPTWGEPRELTKLPALGPDYSLKIDEPYWMTCDGLSTLSLWHGVDRMFTIAFIISREETGLKVYVGGLQGRDGDDVLERYRAMTKDAHGIRPRDLMIELHRMVCRAIGVTDLLAVAEDARHWHHRYADEEARGVASLNYDDAWIERSGERLCANWFALPVAPVRREVSDIPSRKRSLYRQRYAMLDAIEQTISQAVATLVPGRLPVAPMPVAIPQSASIAVESVDA
ncbi:MAG: DUF535 family protein [Sphingomonas sp.]|nr:DUF535 family protein [Sphingomonas sp.]